MSEHKFKKGQVLDFIPDKRSAPARSGRCTVMSLVPIDGDTPQYRVRCTSENFERVVWESQLR